MSSDRICYFGYGSLVNRDTRPDGEHAHSARLNGWRRIWQHRVTAPNRDKRCTSLSIEPCPAVDAGNTAIQSRAHTGIQGVVVSIPASELAQLDEREAGYERLALPVSDFDLPQGVGADTIMVYRSLPENRYLADPEHPVLQSYIDCVMAGFLQRFGEPGLAELVGSTHGWERAIFNDRENPFYPRWVHVEEHRRQLFDSLLATFQ